MKVLKRMKRRINLFMMNLVFDERCTCGEDDGCHICSDSFNVWKYMWNLETGG